MLSYLFILKTAAKIVKKIHKVNKVYKVREVESFFDTPATLSPKLYMRFLTTLRFVRNDGKAVVYYFIVPITAAKKTFFKRHEKKEL